MRPDKAVGDIMELRTGISQGMKLEGPEGSVQEAGEADGISIASNPLVRRHGRQPGDPFGPA
jgi:hypothetical protein